MTGSVAKLMNLLFVTHRKYHNIGVYWIIQRSHNIQSNLDLRTPLYTYFWLTYFFFFFKHITPYVLQCDLGSSFYVLKFGICTLSTLSRSHILNLSAYIKFEYVLRVILSFRFCKFFDLLFWVRHADELQSTCWNPVERKETADFNFTLQ
jgi:hypothetical protein